ncbi:unnamed protein product [Pieris macdunnoughi]|uniref:phosphatidylinositol-3,5-bisphosphate 3-phosphatase n=1 Tax=Pieris macdunnoughi TaxID=345717 RepID=A0A821UA51_9NEOP|nr:unnamed protein product [Pieris macdunnoughi]
MLINTFLDTEDFVHLYYPEDEPPAAQGCAAGARMASKYPRPPSPDYKEVSTLTATCDMSERDRERRGAPPEPPPHRVRAADLYPRTRTHYDEPGLEPALAPICGEFVQWVGRTSDGTIAMSNYRLHLHTRRRGGSGLSVPLRLIDVVEIRDLITLIILCKHGRQLKCTFNASEQCLEWWRRLSTSLAPITSLQDIFAASYAAWAKEQPPSSVHRALLNASQAPHQRHWFGCELERLGFTTKGPWRVSAVNAEYKLCPSYPPLLIVPASIGDEQLEAVARFRTMRRIPAVVWRHRKTGAVIARSSQPEVGWFGWRSGDDEGLLAAFVGACDADRTTPKKPRRLLIVDARSFTSAVTNRARGGGCECAQYYPLADIQFMSLPNIHHVRKSFQQMRDLIADNDQPNWHSALERTLWLQYLSGLLRAACTVARAAADGQPVLVHCSDGWDRTPQLVALAQLLLDPYYRTLEGFRTLVEREWLDYGHKFAERCGHQVGGEDPNERSPVFVQWLHLVHQLMSQFPVAFQFNEAYLIKLATHVHSCMFGTFLCNNRRERASAGDPGPHVWHLLEAPAYRNHLYFRDQEELWPECSVSGLQIWWGLWGGGGAHEPPPASPTPPRPAPPPHNGVMTKTRSCDNLLNEGEKRTAQRRNSDPSLAPDAKLLMLNGRPEEDKVATECEKALSDSCVDSLPPSEPPATHLTLDLQQEEVQLHANHFHPPPRDIASNSSSLERELSLVPDKVDSGSVLDGVAPGLGPDVAVDVTDGGSPDTVDRDVFDLYADVIEIADTSREARTRNISITWRSISESSNQSSNGFDIPENSPQNRLEPVAARLERAIDNRSSSERDTSPDDRISSDRDGPVADDHDSTEADIANHNVVNGNTNHNREGVGNGDANGIVNVAAKFLEVELNGAVSSSSESEGEGRAREESRAGRVPSQLTLCPASPGRTYCRCGSESVPNGVCWCGVCGTGTAGVAGGCVCGEGAERESRGERDSLDGLPPADDPLQARLHQIILYQKKVVDELNVQLRSAHEALRRASPAAHAPPPARHRPSTPEPPKTAIGSSSGGSGSSSGSASEVEVGEEANGVLWLPDSAAPRCQHCRNQFWLARRRHHCRRCGGIFCGSCSEMSSWGDVGSVRVCRRCRALR